MAFTAVGFDGTVTEAQFARLMRYVGEVGYRHGVVSGLTATAGAGTRQASVSTGTAVLPGLLVDSDATVTTSHVANTGTVNRVDHVVGQADWATNTVSVVVVPGAGPTAPAVTQNEGVLWQMPLARVTVRPSVTTLLAADVVVAKPLPRDVQSATTGLTAATRAYNSAAHTVGTVTLPDPGWPYRVQYSVAGRFDGGTGFNGTALLGVSINGAAAVGEGASESLANSGNHSVSLTRTSGILTGPLTVQAQIRPSGMTSSSSLTLLTSVVNFLDVNQIPA